MSTVYRFAENEVPHFITMTLVEWVDLFSRKIYKDLIVENLQFCITNKGLKIHAYVIMTNHMHMIVSSNKENDLSTVIRDFKRFTAKKIYKQLCEDSEESRRNWLKWIFESHGEKSSSNKNMKVWRHENHPVPLDINTMLTQKMEYIHENPVRAGICYEAEGYVYSSAGFYAGRESVLEISAV